MKTKLLMTTVFAGLIGSQVWASEADLKNLLGQYKERGKFLNYLKTNATEANKFCPLILEPNFPDITQSLEIGIFVRNELTNYCQSRTEFEEGTFRKAVQQEKMEEPEREWVKLKPIPMKPVEFSAQAIAELNDHVGEMESVAKKLKNKELGEKLSEVKVRLKKAIDNFDFMVNVVVVFRLELQDQRQFPIQNIFKYSHNPENVSHEEYLKELISVLPKIPGPLLEQRSRQELRAANQRLIEAKQGDEDARDRLLIITEEMERLFKEDPKL